MMLLRRCRSGISVTRRYRGIHVPSIQRQTEQIWKAESFLGGSNATYIEEMYVQWCKDPQSVHKSWHAFFQSGQFTAPPTLPADYTTSRSMPRMVQMATPNDNVEDYVRVTRMARAFQVRGHLLARLDPLGLSAARRPSHVVEVTTKELEPSHYGWSEADMDRVVVLRNSQVSGLLSPIHAEISIRDFCNRMKEIYADTIGIEYMHISSVDMCNWIREKFETRHKVEYSKEEKIRILDRLVWADHFERFLAKKYATAKRFGLEGCEAVIPGMKVMIDRGAELGVQHVVMGMPHRGRLSVLSSVVRKPLENIFHEFSGMLEHDRAVDGSGDVKYHLGMSFKRPTTSGKEVNLTILANPSHLEAVNPVVMGKSRAKQYFRTKEDGISSEDEAAILPLVLHGDAAFAGQGVVYESMMMGDLPDYSTGGTVHVIVNNQIGFTTDPHVARSTPYCTELGKAVGAPIFHVNGDDPEAVSRVCEIAMEWRQKFRRDVIVDIVGYRKHGHNEIDEPSFTQPLMYKKISKHPSVYELYRKKLIDEGTITEAQADEISSRCMRILEESFIASKDFKPSSTAWLQANWDNMLPSHKPSAPAVTGVGNDVIETVGRALITVPPGFVIHKRLKNFLREQKAMVDTGEGVNWGTAEAMAFGSLLLEGTHVRLSGQDVERGTFSHRHSVLHCQNTNNDHRPLNHIAEDQAHYTVCNSHLSEYGVLGFELGYSMEHPNSLVLWEAQFGDFANTAQVIVDQFVSAQEDKWRRQSGMVMLLPHGYEGQGPEHSSARLERYLQMVNEHSEHMLGEQEGSMAIQYVNMQVVNLTTPANYFHALRRQVHRKFRKPLIVMSPKSLLRHPLARSNIAEMTGDTKFTPVYGDTSKELVKDTKIRRVVFCSGKVYYDLVQRRDAENIRDVALVRVEQLAPFPFLQVREQLHRYKKAEVAWCQEEPMNQGAWSYVLPRFITASEKKQQPRYIGRAPSASTAAGSLVNHNRELDAFITEALE